MGEGLIQDTEMFVPILYLVLASLLAPGTTQEFNGYFNAAAGGNSDSCSSFSLPSCHQVGRFLVDLGNLLKNSYCSECSNQHQTTTTTMRTTTTTTATTQAPTTTTGTPCCMRLDIV